MLRPPPFSCPTASDCALLAHRPPPTPPRFPYTTLSRSPAPPAPPPPGQAPRPAGDRQIGPAAETADRKSTRLNSSHSQISYAVFCLKKKKAGWGIWVEVVERVDG